MAIRPLLIALLLAAVPAGAIAHHSFAVFFDDSRMVKVTGTVTEFQFRNPHGLIRMNVRDDSGKESVWRAETNSPGILERRGWKRDSVKAGDVITIEGWPARDGSNYMRLMKATRADGSTIGRPFSMEERDK